MTPEERKDELIKRIRRIVTHGDDDANEDEPMVPAVYWPSRWLTDALRAAQAEQRRKVYERVLQEIDRCPDFGRLIAKDFRADMIERVQHLRDQPEAILVQGDE